MTLKIYEIKTWLEPKIGYITSTRRYLFSSWYMIGHKAKSTWIYEIDWYPNNKLEEEIGFAS